MDLLCFFCLVFAMPLCASVYMCLDRSRAMLYLWIFYVFSVLCLLCLCARLFFFFCALRSSAGKRADLLALVCGV